MNKTLSPEVVFLLMLIFCGVGSVAGQANLQPAGDRPQLEQRDEIKRPNLLRILDLSPAQLLEVRRINQARKPLMEAAQMRLGDANRALDETIYADTFDEAAFESRLKDVQAARAEVARLRFTSEMNIRKILTPEQIARFRVLRRQFAPGQDRRGPRGLDRKNIIPRRARRIP